MSKAGSHLFDCFKLLVTYHHKLAAPANCTCVQCKLSFLSRCAKQIANFRAPYPGMCSLAVQSIAGECKACNLSQTVLLQYDCEYLKVLMSVAAKKERRYLGLVHMDLRETLTPYHAYAMARHAFEEELLDPRDFKKNPAIVPQRVGRS